MVVAFCCGWIVVVVRSELSLSGRCHTRRFAVRTSRGRKIVFRGGERRVHHAETARRSLVRSEELSVNFLAMLG